MTGARPYAFMHSITIAQRREVPEEYHWTMQLNRALPAALLALVLIAHPASAAQSQGPSLSTSEQLMADATTGPCRDDKRLEAVRELFMRCGANDSDVVLVKDRKITNVVVTIRGSGTGTVVIGAHYDKVDDGCGAVDNWSGITILAHLYRTLRLQQPNRTYVFVAFGEEEEGLKGSKEMVAAIPEQQRASYCAMVNFDSFGLGRPQVHEDISTPELTEFIRGISELSKVPFSSAKLGFGDSDSTSFRNGGIPAVTMHGLNDDWEQIIHTREDSKGQLKPASLYYGYVLGLNVLVKLDSCECDAFRDPKSKPPPAKPGAVPSAN